MESSGKGMGGMNISNLTKSERHVSEEDIESVTEDKIGVFGLQGVERGNGIVGGTLGSSDTGGVSVESTKVMTVSGLILNLERGNPSSALGGLGKVSLDVLGESNAVVVGRDGRESALSGESKVGAKSRLSLTSLEGLSEGSSVVRHPRSRELTESLKGLVSMEGGLKVGRLTGTRAEHARGLIKRALDELGNVGSRRNRGAKVSVGSDSVADRLHIRSETGGTAEASIVAVSRSDEGQGSISVVLLGSSLSRGVVSGHKGEILDVCEQ